MSLTPPSRMKPWRLDNGKGTVVTVIVSIPVPFVLKNCTTGSPPELPLLIINPTSDTGAGNLTATAPSPKPSPLEHPRSPQPTSSLSGKRIATERFLPGSPGCSVSGSVGAPDSTSNGPPPKDMGDSIV